MSCPKYLPCTRYAIVSSVPEVAGPDVDVSECGVVAAYVDFVRSIVENYGRTVHFPLEGIEPLSRRRLHLPGVAHRHFFILFEVGGGRGGSHAVVVRPYVASLQSLKGRSMPSFFANPDWPNNNRKSPQDARRVARRALGGGRLAL